MTSFQPAWLIWTAKALPPRPPALSMPNGIPNGKTRSMPNGIPNGKTRSNVKPAIKRHAQTHVVSIQVWLLKGRPKDSMYRDMWERAMDDMIAGLLFKSEPSGFKYIADYDRCPACGL